MRLRTLAFLMLLGVATAAPAQINIGINFSLFPELVRVPDYPVYYAPRQNANYFFYDGLYWVFQGDEWYSSDWYNGPWYRVAPEFVPVYVLRIPVRYYRSPPPYFGGWQRNAPPRWGEHWGHDWERRRTGWDHWNRRAAPAPAPLPTYQRQYSGSRYPRPEQRHAIQDQKYRYQPKDQLVREHVRPEIRAGAPAQSARERAPEPRKDAGKDAREPQPKDAGKDGRDRGRDDANVRGQRPNPAGAPVQRPEPAAQPRPPAAKERKAEPPGRDAGREREREQKARPAPVQKPEPAAQPAPRPQPQAAPPREQPPRPQAAPPREPPPRPQQGAAPGKGGGHEQGKGQDKGQERSRGKGDDK